MKVLEPRGRQALLPGEASVRLRDPRRQARLAEGAIPLFSHDRPAPVEKDHHRSEMIGHHSGGGLPWPAMLT